LSDPPYINPPSYKKTLLPLLYFKELTYKWSICDPVSKEILVFFTSTQWSEYLINVCEWYWYDHVNRKLMTKLKFQISDWMNLNKPVKNLIEIIINYDSNEANISREWHFCIYIDSLSFWNRKLFNYRTNQLLICVVSDNIVRKQFGEKRGQSGWFFKLL
jgi:hypothetical protein